jgi:hypothetical protein
VTLVDVPQQAQEELEGLAHHRLRAGIGLADAPGDEPVEFGNECVCPLGLRGAVLAADSSTARWAMTRRSPRLRLCSERRNCSRSTVQPVIPGAPLDWAGATGCYPARRSV